MPEQCPICGRGLTEQVICDETFEYKGESITIQNFVTYECNVCGESILDNESIRRSDKILVLFKKRVDAAIKNPGDKET